jgi:hypothetical protein
VDAQHRRQLSKHLKSERRDPYLIETLETFDKLIAGGCDQTQRETMVELLCQDLPRADSPFYADYFTNSVKTRMATLWDPWIQTVGHIAAEMYDELDKPSLSFTTLPKSLIGLLGQLILDDRNLDNLSSIWRLRMRLWRLFNRKEMTRVMEQALLDLEELVRICFPF